MIDPRLLEVGGLTMESLAGNIAFRSSDGPYRVSFPTKPLNMVPSIQLLAPALGTPLAGDVTFSILVYDPNNEDKIEHIKYRINGAAWKDLSFTPSRSVYASFSASQDEMLDATGSLPWSNNSLEIVAVDSKSGSNIFYTMFSYIKTGGVAVSMPAEVKLPATFNYEIIRGLPNSQVKISTVSGNLFWKTPEALNQYGRAMVNSATTNAEDIDFQCMLPYKYVPGTYRYIFEFSDGVARTVAIKVTEASYLAKYMPTTIASDGVSSIKASLYPRLQLYAGDTVDISINEGQGFSNAVRLVENFRPTGSLNVMSSSINGHAIACSRHTEIWEGGQEQAPTNTDAQCWLETRLDGFEYTSSNKTYTVRFSVNGGRAIVDQVIQLGGRQVTRIEVVGPTNAADGVLHTNTEYQMAIRRYFNDGTNDLVITPTADAEVYWTTTHGSIDSMSGVITFPASTSMQSADVTASYKHSGSTTIQASKQLTTQNAKYVLPPNLVPNYDDAAYRLTNYKIPYQAGGVWEYGDPTGFGSGWRLVAEWTPKYDGTVHIRAQSALNISYVNENDWFLTWEEVDSEGVSTSYDEILTEVVFDSAGLPVSGVCANWPFGWVAYRGQRSGLRVKSVPAGTDDDGNTVYTSVLTDDPSYPLTGGVNKPKSISFRNPEKGHKAMISTNGAIVAGPQGFINGNHHDWNQDFELNIQVYKDVPVKFLSWVWGNHGADYIVGGFLKIYAEVK